MSSGASNTTNLVDKKITTVKSSVAGIKWKQEYVPVLKKLVSDVHALVTHMYLFARYIFIQELACNNAFDLEDYVKQGFFKEVFLSLVEKRSQQGGKMSDKVKSYRTTIQKYKESYLKHSSFTPKKLSNAYQIAAYEATKIQTAYLNSVILQFGNKLRMVINKLVKIKERISHLTEELKKKGRSDEEIKLAIKTDIVDPVTKLKLAISSKDMNQIPKNFLDEDAIKHISNFLSTYLNNYRFQKNSIYYDAIANPGKHMKAYFKLAEICESYKFKSFQCFPLRHTFIPSYMTIDTMILNNQILKDSKRSKLDKSLIWGKVVDLSNKAMKDQGPNKSMKFRETIMTDGIGISILKQNLNTEKGNSSSKMKTVEEDIQYIESISKEELLSTKGKAVLIDPGRRDLLFCMHEDSTAKEKKLYRYTRNQKAKELKSTKFRKLRQQVKPADVQECENKLSQYSSSTVNAATYIDFLKIRAQVSPTLIKNYSNEDAETSQRNENSIPFRKLKLSSYINQIQADKRLSRNLRNKFGNDCILIIGNWSATQMKFHEPIRGKNMRKVLRKEGFQVYLLDEYKTSSICPCCDNELEKFKEVVNPRPYRRLKNPTVRCHGLLRCKNQQCLKSEAPLRRLWNRDLAAVLNFRRILFSLRSSSQRPNDFSRGIKRRNVYLTEEDKKPKLM